jgi:transposase
MERTDILELMSTLKLYGMRAAGACPRAGFQPGSGDEVMTTGIKRRHEPPRIVGDLLSADRLDTALLMRAFLRLRGEADHRSMAAIPTLEEEDRKRPNREHQKLSGEKTRIISRVKGTVARLGIRKFSGNLRYAADRLKQMRTPEDVAIPPNTLAELERDLARLRFIREQSRAIEKTRVGRLNESPLDQPHAMVLMLAKVRGIGIETADMLVK